MAYTVTTTDLGEGDYRITIAGASIAAATEATITGIPSRGRVRRVKASLTSGTGATLDPILGITTNPADSDVVWENGTAQADVDDQPDAFYYSSTNTLYYRGKPDAGSDNVTEVEILISARWAD